MASEDGARRQVCVPVLPSHPGRGRTLADVVTAWALWSPDRVVLIDSGGTWTWGWLQARIEAFAAGLAGCGVRHGDAVVVAEVPSADMVALYLATARAGAVLVPLNLRWRPAELAPVRDVVTPALALAGAGHTETAAAAVPAGTTVLASGEGGRWGDQLAAAGSGPRLPGPGGGYDDPHLLLFTSGTTGRPKAAVLGQRRSIGDAAGAALASGVRAGDRLLAYQPLFHTGGWDFLKQYLLVGGSAVLMPAFDPDQALALIEEHRCTSIFAVPLVLLKMMESPAFASADLSSLRRLMFASYDPSDLIVAAARALRDRGARDLMLEHVYGQTEAGSFITTLRWEDARGGPGALESVGTPVPGVTVGLLDPSLRPVPRGEIGEVCVRAETVMLGYLGNQAATEEAFRGGWLHTGDLGRQDPDGQLRLSGRLREMIRTAGENVYPKEVEQVLAAHPRVTDCAVFGVPDARWDERVVAVVACGPPAAAPPSEAELAAYLRERLAGYKVPRKILLVPEIPKTPAGKTARQLLPGLLGSGDANG